MTMKNNPSIEGETWLLPDIPKAVAKKNRGPGYDLCDG